MRKHLYFISLLAVLCTFLSCQKEYSGEIVDTTTTTGVVTSGNMKAKINSVQWIANAFTTASRMSGVINITGKSSNGKLITITLTDSGVHHYILDQNTMNAAAYTDSADTNPYAYTTNQGVLPGQGGGDLTITSIDTAKKTLTGTFSFKVYRQQDSAQLNITEGSFTDLSYAVTLQAANATDTFKVKIDNVSWAPVSIIGSSVSGMLIINATDAVGVKTVGLQIPSNITPGSYAFTFLTGQYTGLYNSDATHFKASSSGTLTILEHNTTTKRIRGNFNFHAEELISPAFSELTEGYFSVKYN